MATISAGDTAYVLISGALVLVMTPGLGLFYSGMVGERNVLNTLMLSFVAMSLVGVQWLLIGYAFAFGPGTSFIGGGGFYGAIGIGLEPYAPYGDNLPHLAFWWFHVCDGDLRPGRPLGLGRLGGPRRQNALRLAARIGRP
mmetsp:Transcript_18043/g.41278  ORF Transcript_18043/g.41278 Transcript_18043/m.41278 type:complete len:141 (+) Transcript_18043:356-778(+)